MTDYSGNIISKEAVRGPSQTLIINELHSLTTDMADITHDHNFHQVLASHVVISSVDASLNGHVRSRKSAPIDFKTLAARWMVSPDRAKRTVQLIFLRTAYGDSKTFAGSSIEIKMQGLGQGNGASPAGWCVISIVILRAHGAKGHGAHFMAPISLIRRSLSAILYVNDTDLLHINMDAEESIVEVHAAIPAGH